MPNSFQIWFEFKTEADASNGMRYATREAAESAASAKFMAWTMPTGYHIGESDDQPNVDAEGKYIPAQASA